MTAAPAADLVACYPPFIVKACSSFLRAGAESCPSPNPPFNFRRTQGFGMPQIWSIAIWGGIQCPGTATLLRWRR